MSHEIYGVNKIILVVGEGYICTAVHNIATLSEVSLMGDLSICIMSAHKNVNSVSFLFLDLLIVVKYGHRSVFRISFLS